MNISRFSLLEKIIPENKPSPLRDYAIAILAVAIATILKILLTPIIKVESPFLLYFGAVMLANLFGGWRAGVLATILAASLSDYFFLSPTHRLLGGSFGQMVRLGIFISEGLLNTGIIWALKSATQRLRLSQKTLKQSEERHRLLVDTVQDYAIYMLDPDGYVTSWNNGAQRIKGYRADEIIGRHFSCFYSERDIQERLPQLALQEAVTKGRAELEGWRIRKNGSRFWANVVITALRDEAGNLRGFSKVIRDVTERKQAQEQLTNLNNILEQRVQERTVELEQARNNILLAFHRLNGIIESTNDIIAALDLDFKLIAFNTAFKQEFIRVFGQEPKLGMSLLDALAHLPVEQAKVRGLWGRAFQGEQFTTIEEFGAPELERHYYEINFSSIKDENNQVIGACQTVRNVTSRIHNEEQIRNLNHELEERVIERTQALETEIQERIKIEVNLRESEDRFRTLADNISQLAWMAEENGSIFWYNRRWSDYTGTTLEEMQGWGWQKVHHPDYLQGAIERFSHSINTGEPWEDTFPLRGKNGEFRWFLSRALPIRDEQGNIVRWFGTNTDIQDIQVVQDALRESEENFRATFNQAAVGIAHLTIDGHFQLINQKLCDILGYTKAELEKLTVADLSYPDDLEIDLENVRRILANEIQSYSMEKRYIRKDGSLVWGNLTVSLVREANGEPKYIIGVVEDISDRKQYEAALKAKNQEIITIFESISDAVVILDIEWRYIYANDKAENFLGKTKNELIGNIIWELFPHTLDWPGYEYCHRAMAEQIIIEYEEYHSHIEKWLEVRLYPSTDGLAIYFRDVTDRKQAEIALRLSESKYRRLADANVVGIFVANYNGEIIEANDAFVEMLGYTRSDVDAGEVDWRNISPPEYLPQDAEKLQELEQTGKAFLEKEYIHKNGSRVPVLIAAAKLEGYQEAAICMIVDLTERKQAELALQQSEERFRSAILNAPLPIMIHAENGEMLLINEVWTKLTGYTHAEVPTVAEWTEKGYGERKEAVLALINETYKRNERIDHGELTINAKSGNTRIWNIHSAPLGCLLDGRKAIIAMAIDITDRKQAENALRKSEKHFRNLADSMPQIIWTSNPDGTVDYYNQRINEFSGFLEKQDGTWEWQPVLHEDDRQRTMEAWQQALEAGELYECEHRVKRINGEFYWYLSRAIPIKDEQGRIVKWYGSATDIHAQKQYQAEREELLQREQAARTEAELASRLKDEFLATLSHELRTPMNAMLGWTSMLRTRKMNEATTVRALETIERNTRTLNQLIEDILDVSRIIRGKVRLNLQPIKLMPAIEEAIETVKPTAEAKDIQIIVEPSLATDLIVMGDSSRLQQIVWNLLANAIKFTPNHGSVTVRLSKIDDGSERLQNCYAQIQVSDTGIGIDLDFLPFVFDRFRQADGSITRSHGGLGLGLAIVRHLVELHGGKVEVHSLGAGQGATFNVNLPLVVKSNTAGVQESREDEIQSYSDSSLLKDLQVLLVDDEPDARHLVTVILEDRGAKVTAVGSAQEALAVLQKLHPDIIVSDIGMPEDDGYSLIRQIRKLPPEAGGQIPAIALTAYATAEDRNAAIAAGFQRHIPKPVDPTELTMAIAAKQI